MNIKHIAMYLRISQEKKNENTDTLDNHREILIEHAKSNGYTYEVFGEVLSGGKSEMEQRPKLQELLNKIENFDAILCVELSRLSRNGLISQTVKQHCIDYDKPIITPYKTYDLANSDTDRLMFDVGSMISSHEHGVIGKRSKVNKIQMTKSGMHVSGNVAFGYKRNSKTKKLEIDEETAPTIKYIFELHAKGLGSYKIRDILNKEGYKSATGKYFNLPSVKRIIRNPVYKGTLIFNDRKKTKKGNKFVYENISTITFENAHPAIIEPDVWNMANAERVKRAEKSIVIRDKPATKTGVTSIKDLIYCGLCGRKMAVRKDSKCATGYIVKRCEYLTDNGEKCNNSGIRLVFVEKNVFKKLNKYKEKLKIMIKELENSNTSSLKTEQNLKLKQFDKKIESIKQQQTKLIDLALSGMFSNDEIKDKKQELINQLEQFTNEKSMLLNTMEDPDVEVIIDKANATIEEIDTLPYLNQEETNQTLKRFIKKIHYQRVIPQEILNLSTRNENRKFYPFELDIEYY